ncbi:helix-turn-helix transcriptional regulator [Mycolicibacterium gadium]|uniref:Transcriptional regulator n=1 Tax=Mycolicibacterium gadium TaxID=1794 RepID=A0A7I7WKU5_MYCGU|nr:helix-turn-helix domain-containing protein [Mycolicibacterium gadium]MBY0286133.1 ArsR family transcriptional regulator [Mycobacteriaceae bacterium]BBZ17562.1 transcriptional regulator [Mycolicibacterium gadium]
MQRHAIDSRPDRAAGQQRQKVLGLLQSAAGPVDARHVADSLQIHITTARFHLTTLEDQGYIRRGGGAKVARAGRPRLTYEVAPRLDYADIVSLFAAHLGGTVEERERRALRIGADLAHRVRVARERDETTIADLVVATLSELGFQVRSVLNSFGEVTVQLCTCPLAEVAATAPEVVRGIQQGLMQEVVDLNADAIGASYRVAVTPDSRTGSCEIGLILSPKT